MTNVFKCLLKLQGLDNEKEILAVCEKFNCAILYHTDIAGEYIRVTCELTDEEKSITTSVIFKNISDWIYEARRARRGLLGVI
jgi:hypothetical protein